MKNNELTRIDGALVEISAPRVGTKCRICGEKIDDHEFIKISTPSLKSAFVHKECVRQRAYHEKFVSPNGNELPLFADSKATKDEIQFACEFETSNFNVLSIEKRAEILGRFVLYAEKDISLGRYGAELHPLRRLNLHGFKATLDELSKCVDMTSERCGLHEHFGFTCDKWFSELDTQDIFADTLEYLEMHVNEHKQIFGRYSNAYCNMTCGGGHYDGIHICYTPDYHAAHIEYRFGHFVNAAQAFHMTALYMAWTKELKAYFDGKQDAKRASKHILKLTLAHVNGTALYQRPERNAK